MPSNASRTLVLAGKRLVTAEVGTDLNFSDSLTYRSYTFSPQSVCRPDRRYLVCHTS